MPLLPFMIVILLLLFYIAVRHAIASSAMASPIYAVFCLSMGASGLFLEVLAMFFCKNGYWEVDYMVHLSMAMLEYCSRQYHIDFTMKYRRNSPYRAGSMMHLLFSALGCFGLWLVAIACTVQPQRWRPIRRATKYGGYCLVELCAKQTDGAPLYTWAPAMAGA